MPVLFFLFRQRLWKMKSKISGCEDKLIEMEFAISTSPFLSSTHHFLSLFELDPKTEPDLDTLLFHQLLKILILLHLSPKAISPLDIWKYSIALILPHICTASTNPTPSSPTYPHLLCLSESGSHCRYEGGFDLVHCVGVFVCACELWWMDRPWTNSSECYISSIVVLIHHYCT